MLMDPKDQYPLRLPAVRVSQPLGDFFAVSIKAKVLKEIVFMDPVRVAKFDQGSLFYSLTGAQRTQSSPRLRQIAKFIDTDESAFPNSIILAANYTNYGVFKEGEKDEEDAKSVSDDEATRWRIEFVDDKYILTIPTNQIMASVVDGQHRLLGFKFTDVPERQDMELLCSVYMDLPMPFQAYLFATININQRSVDKSLAYEQFGYNLEDEAPARWSPDKLAVFLTRKLNLDPESPLRGRVKIAPINDIIFHDERPSDWQVSTASIVEGIIRLISSNAQNDRSWLHEQTFFLRTRESLQYGKLIPFRDLYKQGKDAELYTLIIDFFKSANMYLWEKANDESYIIKTVGIQALFDVLRVLGLRYEINLLPAQFERVIKSVSSVDFSDPFYQASGKGRNRIKNTILLYSDLSKLSELPVSDQQYYKGLLERYRPVLLDKSS